MSDLIRQSRVIDSLVKQGNDNQLKKTASAKSRSHIEGDKVVYTQTEEMS